LRPSIIEVLAIDGLDADIVGQTLGPGDEKVTGFRQQLCGIGRLLREEGGRHSDEQTGA
jgi:hypothetical protein